MGSDKVGTMFQTVFNKPYSNPTLMESLKAVVENQKYLLSPMSGIVDHIPELELLHDVLYRKLQENHKKYFMKIDEDLPDSFGQYLLANVHRFYGNEAVTLRPGENAGEVMRLENERYVTDICRINNCISDHFSAGRKLKLYEGSIRALI
jgi:hypothetical protein